MATKSSLIGASLRLFCIFQTLLLTLIGSANAEDFPALNGSVVLELNNRTTWVGPNRAQRDDRYLFAEAGFRGNTKNYYEVENSYLNCVMDRRTGIPISLSTVYLLMGKRLQLPVHGIGMPGHFLVKFDSDKYKIFIDCWNGGAGLTEQNCARLFTEPA